MKQILSEEFKRMQKLAGIIKEGIHDTDILSAPHTNVRTPPQGIGDYDPKERAANLKALSDFGPKNNELATQIAKDTTGEDLFDLVNQNSIEFTYGPKKDGTYHLGFQLEATPKDLGSYTPQEFKEELQSVIGGSSSRGPGQSFRKVTVSYDGEENGTYIFSVFLRGGYDI